MQINTEAYLAMDTQRNLLEQLKDYTVVVADSGDIRSIRQYTPRDSTTNPSLLSAAAQMPEYSEVVDQALRWAREQSQRGGDVLSLAIDRLSIEFGLRILEIIPGRVSTEVDARLSYSTDRTIEKARMLIGQYEKANLSRERILIKIASTWEGIRAAEVLEKEGIHCNLTLLFALHQAVACAEAGVTLISPFVGRILDWHLKAEGRKSYPPAEDPGVRSVTEIYDYFKHFGYKTEIMGASFRNIGEITELAGCDLLTISPKLLGELQSQTGTLTRKLDPKKAQGLTIERRHYDQQSFDAAHRQNRMAQEKLQQGIEDFSKAIEALEGLLSERLKKLS